MPSACSDSRVRISRFTWCVDSRSKATAVRNSFLDVAVDVAQESGAMLVEAFARGVQSESKGRLDIVTEADRASERLVVGRIRSEFPTHAVVSEEGGGHAGGPDPYCWYVD